MRKVVFQGRGEKYEGLSYSTISTHYFIAPIIGDNWSGTPIGPLSWSISFEGHETGWLSSLDYRSHKEAVFMGEQGLVDQAQTNWITQVTRCVSQRPALF